ncbi:cupredoxin family copper-binding protein [Pararhodobacter sp. CCB-MM2]|uniref:cupredoxin domain-containing protein n=1 Tax=Pararhodobacter sp. CCB-MM2 TaxID=1786003 RepID=UPI00111217DE|nr:cupredoxin family copper-binding protein [Pararhodobacter sp. CCB-MM2]
MTAMTRRSALALVATLPLLPRHAQAAGSAEVAISGMAFAPASISVSAGTTIRWTNQDGAPHTATFSGMATPRLNRGDSAELTFDTPGTYDYACAIHPSMRGQVVVTG